MLFNFIPADFLSEMSFFTAYIVDVENDRWRSETSRAKHIASRKGLAWFQGPRGIQIQDGGSNFLPAVTRGSYKGVSLLDRGLACMAGVQRR